MVKITKLQKPLERNISASEVPTGQYFLGNMGNGERLYVKAYSEVVDVQFPENTYANSRPLIFNGYVPVSLEITTTPE